MRNPAHMNNGLLNYTVKSLIVMSKIITIMGLLLFFGAVGGYDHGVMEFGKMIIYMAIGLCFSIGGVLAIKFFGGYEDEDEDDD